MTEFETRLDECLEALSAGRWDLDECLRRYPEHAAELRPMLLAAAMTARALDVQPRPEFAAAARERFLVATGQRLQETMDVEPAPAFFAAARMRFLLAAQRMKLGEAATQRAARRLPIFGSPMRALATGMAALVLMLGVSTYTVASASAALPGDWQYPIKLETERVRVALAFSDDAKINVKLDIAEERVNEIEQLAKRGRIIGPGVLDRLAAQTQPLIDDARAGGWQPGEAARLQQVSAKQQEVLAMAAAQIAPDAQANLAVVTDVSKSAQDVSKRILFFANPHPPVVLTPSVPLTATPAPTSTPEPSPSAESTTPASPPPPGATTTAPGGGGPPTASAVSAAIVISATPVETRNNVHLHAVTAGLLSFLVPGSVDGWKLVDAPSQGVPPLIKFSNADDTSLIVISTVNGDMYWYIGKNGRFDEVQMRITKASGVFVADRDVLRTAYGDASDIPWYVMQSIVLAVPATPTATPTATATPAAATATAAASDVLTPQP